MMNIFDIVEEFHEKMGHVNRYDEIASDPEKLKAFIELRVRMMEEELTELKNAIADKDAAEIVDALIDGLYFNVGTLNILIGTDMSLGAFIEVHDANMEKEIGVKPGRPNPLGLPDAIKPEGWKAPDLSSYVIDSKMLKGICA